MEITRLTTTPPAHATSTTAPPDPEQLELPLPAVPAPTPAAPRPDMSAAAPATGRPSPPAARAARTSAPAAPEQLELRFPSRAPLLTTPQAAHLLGVPARQLERWRGDGQGPHYVRLSRKYLRYRIEDIEAFIGANRRASTAHGAGRPDAP